MGRLDKITSMDDIKDLVRVDAFTVSVPSPPHPLKGKHKSKEHKAAISKSRKEFYSSEKGLVQKQNQSKKMQEYYGTKEGQEHIQKLKDGACKREQRRAVTDVNTRRTIVQEHNNGRTVTELANEYRVSRATIHRYIKEFS